MGSRRVAYAAVVDTPGSAPHETAGAPGGWAAARDAAYAAWRDNPAYHATDDEDPDISVASELGDAPARRRLLTAAEVAEWLAVSQATVRREAKNGRLEVVRVGRRLRFSATGVESYLAARLSAGRADEDGA